MAARCRRPPGSRSQEQAILPLCAGPAPSSFPGTALMAGPVMTYSRRCAQPTPAAPESSPYAPGPSRSPQRVFWTDCQPRPTGRTPRSRTRPTRPWTSHPMSCTSTTGMWPAALGSRPVSTCACTLCAATTGLRPPIASHGEWSSRLTAQEARPSTSHQQPAPVIRRTAWRR